MTRLTWGEVDRRHYEFGVDRGVFYPKGGIGYAWQGLTSVQDKTVGASQKYIYIDGVGHQNHLLMGNFGATISAITYPREFEPYDGYEGIFSGQPRRAFDFSYRTMQDGGHYKIHLVYNAFAVPSDRTNSTVNSDVDMSLFTWEIVTTAESIEDARDTAHFVIDTRYINPGILEALETRIYGGPDQAADMPTVDELLAMFEEYAVFKVTPHGDGTVTISGPDIAVHEVSPTLWELDWPSVVQVDTHTYRATSL